MIQFLIALFLWSAVGNAETQHWGLAPSDVAFKKSDSRGFSQIEVAGYELSKKIGAPELPVKSLLVAGQPHQIKVDVQTLKNFRQAALKPQPVQEQLCRCANDQKRTFKYDPAAYRQTSPSFEMEYLGMFRGQPITRIDVAMAQYQPATNSVTFFSDVRVSYNAKEFSLQGDSYTDYLIVVPSQLVAGVQSFAAWKESQGYKVTVEEIQTPQLTLQGIATVIAQNYKNNGTDFVLLIGDEDTLPMFKVSTSGGTTPSDLKYFTLDGGADLIPDVFAGRIPATSASEVEIHLAKAIQFEKTGTKDASGVRHVIGIASNEGSSPSDDEYVTSIEDKLKDVYGYESSHYYQNDKKSIPTELNTSINAGAAWLFYMGHGSGYSWPSMYRDYHVTEISKLDNSDDIQPIIIDVACMNGRLLPGYLGTSFTDTTSSNAHGATAYYGGTVNISWHPPAVMARGIAFEHAAKNFKHLGEALLAGQLYLAANWNYKQDVEDNLEWYHLQGDPSMLIQE